ncbi:MAG: hypothetical protein IJM41_01930 [Bacteroidales bacterium]|nr:hypothetical protein [Bacteroidales bacterium]
MLDGNESGQSIAVAKSFFRTKADRPFFYVITDNETGLILFIGRFC